MKVAFHTLGCKLNYSETSTIARMFESSGYARARTGERAGVCVINTCSVTENAERKCRRAVRQALRGNPGAFVAVIGCYAQLNPGAIARIPGVDLVLGANEKFNLHAYIISPEKKKRAEVNVGKIQNAKEFFPGFSIGGRTRSFLKVQDGCDYSCSFCTVPLARGASRSSSIEETVKTARMVAQTGVKEIVLTGVNIGDFGTPSSRGGKETFLNLVRELDKTEGIERFRISSIEPNLLSDEIIRFVAKSNKFMPHFHIPLQSGSDKILRQMRRRYGREMYSGRVRQIKRLMPHCCIGADVIAGFPGETDEDFLESYRFINELDISYLHVFAYSERDNTSAINIKGTVPMQAREKRSRMLRNLSEKKRAYFYRQNTGRKATVLFEAGRQGEMMHGFTENYIRVKHPCDALLANELKTVKLSGIANDGAMKAEILNESIPV